MLTVLLAVRAGFAVAALLQRRRQAAARATVAAPANRPSRARLS